MSVNPAMIQAGGDLAAGLLGKSSARKAARREYERQKEFAQFGIRWKVEDAKAAGLHPLSVLGTPSASYSPVMVGDPMADAMSNMGQNLSRAARAGMTPEEREIHDLQVAEVKSRIGENDARRQLLLSEAARNEAEARGRAKAIPMSAPPAPSVVHTPGGKFPTGPTTDAQTVEDHYSDLVGNAYGLWRFGADGISNFWDAVEKANPWWLRMSREGKDKFRRNMDVRSGYQQGKQKYQRFFNR